VRARKIKRGERRKGRRKRGDRGGNKKKRRTARTPVGDNARTCAFYLRL
jgi:hypothetical protein